MATRVNNADLGSLENERDELRRELQGTQEMLAFVLDAIGEPVFVPKEALTEGLPNNTQIVVDDDLQREGFVFRLATGE